jgi:hypothetical protein
MREVESQRGRVGFGVEDGFPTGLICEDNLAGCKVQLCCQNPPQDPPGKNELLPNTREAILLSSSSFTIVEDGFELLEPGLESIKIRHTNNGVSFKRFIACGQLVK